MTAPRRRLVGRDRGEGQHGGLEDGATRPRRGPAIAMSGARVSRRGSSREGGREPEATRTWIMPALGKALGQPLHAAALDPAHQDGHPHEKKREFASAPAESIQQEQCEQGLQLGDRGGEGEVRHAEPADASGSRRCAPRSAIGARCASWRAGSSSRRAATIAFRSPRAPPRTAAATERSPGQQQAADRGAQHEADPEAGPQHAHPARPFGFRRDVGDVGRGDAHVGGEGAGEGPGGDHGEQRVRRSRAPAGPAAVPEIVKQQHGLAPDPVGQAPPDRREHELGRRVDREDDAELAAARPERSRPRTAGSASRSRIRRDRR